MISPAPIDPPEINARLWDGIGSSGARLDDLTAWDVGANCGQTLPILLNRFSVVVAFEPAQECRPFLTPFLTEGVTLCDCAVSDHDGTVTLAALPDKINTGQLVTPGTHGMEWTPDVPDAVARTVPCRTLDTLAAEFGEPDFIKVDVEGHEAKVLDGARGLLRRAVTDWLIEFHTPQLHSYCRDLLNEAGYTTDVVRHPHYPVNSPMWYQHGWLRAFC